MPTSLLSLPFCSNKLGRVVFSFLFIFDPAGPPAAVRACRQAGQAGKLSLLISVAQTQGNVFIYVQTIHGHTPGGGSDFFSEGGGGVPVFGFFCFLYHFFQNFPKMPLKMPECHFKMPEMPLFGANF